MIFQPRNARCGLVVVFCHKGRAKMGAALLAFFVINIALWLLVNVMWLRLRPTALEEARAEE